MKREGQNVRGEVLPTGHVTSVVPLPPGSLPLVSLVGWGNVRCSWPSIVSPSSLSLGSLSPWRLGTVCGALALCPWGGSADLGVGCQRSRWSGSPRNWGGGEGEEAGSCLALEDVLREPPTGVRVRAHAQARRRGQAGSRFPSLTRWPDSWWREGPASSPTFSQLQCCCRLSLPVMAAQGQRGPSSALFPWKLVGSPQCSSQAGGFPRRRPAG